MTVCFNGFNSEIGFSQNFHFKSFPDSRGERERERKKREPRSRLRLRRRTQSPDHAFDFADLRTHEPIFKLEPSTHRSTNPRTDLRPRAFAPRTHEPISLSLSKILIFYVISPPVLSIAAPCRSHQIAPISSIVASRQSSKDQLQRRSISPPPRDLTSRSNPVASLSSFFSQFDRI